MLHWDQTPTDKNQSEIQIYNKFKFLFNYLNY